jgi:hypothetical protein
MDKDSQLIFEAYEDDKKDPHFWFEYLVNAWKAPNVLLMKQVGVVHDEVDRDTFRKVFKLVWEAKRLPDVTVTGKRKNFTAEPFIDIHGRNLILSYMSEFDTTLKTNDNPDTQPDFDQIKWINLQVQGPEDPEGIY